MRRFVDPLGSMIMHRRLLLIGFALICVLSVQFISSAELKQTQPRVPALAAGCDLPIDFR
jgi:hypothetical protein